jgi:hypothetical protein
MKRRPLTEPRDDRICADDFGDHRGNILPGLPERLPVQTSVSSLRFYYSQDCSPRRRFVRKRGTV